MSYKLLIAFIFLILAIFLQLLFGEAAGIWVNFTLAALVVAAFFVNFLELLVLVLFSVFVLNWQPEFSLELVLYAALPLLILLLRKFFPVKSWLGIPTAIFLCTSVFYLVLGPRFLVASPVIFLWDVAGGLAFGAIFFKVYEASNRSIDV